MVKSIKPTLNKIRASLDQRQRDAQAKYGNLSTGFLGNHSGTVATGAPGVVYVTKRNGQVVQCINRRVQNVPYKPVVIGIDPAEPGILQVLYARDVWGTQDDTPNVAEHARTHAYGGGDTLFIDADQVKPFLLLPSGSSTVQLLGGQYHTKAGSAGQVSSQLVNLTSYKPTSGARYVLIEHDDDGNIVTTAGATVTSLQALGYNDIPTITRNPIGAVRLYNGQSTVQRNPAGQYDFVDLRWSHNIIAGSGDYTAAQITNVPSGRVASTNVQLALDELDAEKSRVVEDVETTTVTVSNTVTETALYTAREYANRLAAGNVIRVHANGVISNATAADDITFKIYIGSTLLETFNPAIGNVSGAVWHVDLSFTVRSIGASGSTAYYGNLEIVDGTTLYEDRAASVQAVNTTTRNDITVKVTWDNAKSGNTISLYQGYTKFLTK